MSEPDGKRGPDRGYASDVSEDGRLSAPAATRNRDVLSTALAAHAPSHGHALEIASGTGQHVVQFARAMPGLIWQPTDPAADRRASIAAWMRAEPSTNIRPPVDLDACRTAWAAEHGPADLIFLANLLHLVTLSEAKHCLHQIALALAPEGLAAIYGPFLRDGVATSEGDAAFDARIRAETPAHGYKDLAWVQDQLADAGLSVDQAEAMPANNLLVLARKPAALSVT